MSNRYYKLVGIGLYNQACVEYVKIDNEYIYGGYDPISYHCYPYNYKDDYNPDKGDKEQIIKGHNLRTIKEAHISYSNIKELGAEAFINALRAEEL